MQKQLKDYVGTNIEAGNWAIRAQRKYNSPTLKFVRVTKALRTIGFTRDWSDKWRTDHVQAGSFDSTNIMVVPEDLVPQEVKDLFEEWNRNR